MNFFNKVLFSVVQKHSFSTDGANKLINRLPYIDGGSYLDSNRANLPHKYDFKKEIKYFSFSYCLVSKKLVGKRFAVALHW